MRIDRRRFAAGLTGLAFALSALVGQFFTQSPQRMHSMSSGVLEGSTPILQVFLQMPQWIQALWSSFSR